MLLLRRCLLAFLVLFAIPLQPASAQTGWLYENSDVPPDPAWQFGALPNGLRYAIRQNPLPQGQVSIRLRIDAGSLHEEDHERGWAHLVEHMLFRGTRSFGDREARHIWEQLGADFGSDTNASTDPTNTVYQLDLPHADRASLDKSLAIIAEMADVALFDPAAVAAEQKIVLAEKRRRSEIAVRYDAVSRPLLYAGLKYADRDTIGTDETLSAATPEGLRAFYERWYRPDRATLVIVGDVEPALLAELIAKNFSGWAPAGPAPQEPDYGAIAEVERRTAALAYPGAPNNVTASWLRPFRSGPDTIARKATAMAEQLAAQIINRRLEAKARGGAAFINAAIVTAELRNVAEVTQLSLTAKDGKWQDALSESFAILADALRAPPSESEIARELSNVRTVMKAAVAGEPTVKSQQWAQLMVKAVDEGEVVASATTMLSILDTVAPQMTAQRIAAATRDLFEGSGPRMVVLTPNGVDGGGASLEAALAAAEAAAPAGRLAERTIGFDDLPPLGTPGREVSRRRIEDLGVTIVHFANGSSLTFKQTDFEKGSVLVQLRFGNGLSGLPPQEPSLAWTASVVSRAGLADLDLDAMERLMTGRRMNLAFGVNEDSFVLSGATNAEDLPDQLRLLSTKLAFPRWDPPLFDRIKSGWLESYELSFGSASARAGRELGSVMRPGDERWEPVDRERILTTGPEAFEAFFAPALAAGPVQAIIVGDVDLDTAVAAMAATVGALPPRPAPPQPKTAVRPPAPDPEPVRFTHRGDKDQAYAFIGWSTFGGTGRILERRALSVAANILQLRLFERLREEEGATYSPGASAISSRTFPDWGVFVVNAEIKPESADSFFRIAREEIAALAAEPAAEEEFARALNPILSGIERRIETNGYWLSALEDWTTDPELIEQTRSYLADYKAMTAEDVRRAVASYVADEGDWSMLVVPDRAEDGGN